MLCFPCISLILFVWPQQQRCNDHFRVVIVSIAQWAAKAEGPMESGTTSFDNDDEDIGS